MEHTIEHTTNTHAREQIGTYLERVVKLLALIKLWLREERLEVSNSQDVVVENLGTYQIPLLTVTTSTREQLAQIKPVSASVIVGDGLIEIQGWLPGKEYLVYLRKPDPALGKALYKGIFQEGWYWIEDNRRNRAHLLDKPLLLDIITLVSDYEF
jgi:hypothetical protein